MQQPPIFINGFQISEPMTTATDLLVAGVCFYGYYQLNQRKNDGELNWHLKYYLLMMALSTFFGGLLGHGFQHIAGFIWKVPGWLFGMYSLLFLERASIIQASKLLKPKTSSILKTFNIIEIVIFTIIVLYTLDFIYVGIHSAVAILLVVLPLQIYIYKKTKSPVSFQFLVGVGWACVAYAIFISEVSLHIYFNHLDIAHIFMVLASWKFYQGGLKIGHEFAAKEVIA
jgi:hypothetical protein